MKAIIQRVMQSSVTVDGKLINAIGKGICVLVGIDRKDKAAEMEYMARKIVNLRIFDDSNGKTWEKSVKDHGYEILCISQFTLAMVLKGNKPDFHDAMAPEYSEQYYNDFLEQMKSMYHPDKIKGGVFGANMQVHIQNDGPVTIPLETPSSLQDPNFLAKQERKAEAAKKREKKCKNDMKSNQSSDSLQSQSSQSSQSEVQQSESANSLEKMSLSEEQT